MLKHIPFNDFLRTEWGKINIFWESLLIEIEKGILNPEFNATLNESFLLESENHF